MVYIGSKLGDSQLVKVNKHTDATCKRSISSKSVFMAITLEMFINDDMNRCMLVI